MKTKDGAKVIILSPNKILLFHRDNIATIPSPDCWQMVGGGIEEGETPEEALKREVKEEVGYDLINYEFITETTGRFGENVWVYAAFVDKSEEKKFKLGEDEGQGIGWFTINEALKLNLTPGMSILLSKHRNVIKRMMKTKVISEIDIFS